MLIYSCSVYKLQCRVASPGTFIPPPTPAIDAESEHKDSQMLAPDDNSNLQVGDEQASASDENEEVDESEDSEDQEDNEDEDVAPEFIPDQCLFCGERCGTFNACVAHMSKAHSFFIPYQSFLHVDLEVLVWYLHLVIYGYHECISCSTRRSTLEAIQQHFIAKSHCRFDISGELAEFYDLSKLEVQVCKSSIRVDEKTLRLSSGKLLSHRSDASVGTRACTSRQSSQPSLQLPGSSEKPSNLTAVDKKDRQLDAAMRQLSCLSASDQRSLAGLPATQQRSILVTRKKQLDKARRAERRYQSTVQRQGNKTLRVHLGSGPGLLKT
jgi:pre-60S factor REI1